MCLCAVLWLPCSALVDMCGSTTPLQQMQQMHKPWLCPDRAWTARLWRGALPRRARRPPRPAASALQPLGRCAARPVSSPHQGRIRT